MFVRAALTCSLFLFFSFFFFFHCREDALELCACVYTRRTLARVTDCLRACFLFFLSHSVHTRTESMDLEGFCLDALNFRDVDFFIAHWCTRPCRNAHPVDKPGAASYLISPPREYYKYIRTRDLAHCTRPEFFFILIGF